MAGESSRNRSNMSELGEKRHCADPGDSCKCGNICNRMQRRGACPCLVRGCFCSERCKCGTQKQPCTNVLGGPGSKLSEQLGIERIEIATAESDEGVETSVSSLLLLLPLLATLNILPRGVSCEKERASERERETERGGERSRDREKKESELAYILTTLRHDVILRNRSVGI